ncbi:methyltransferase domain-containing protein [Ditylenchus destructor]|uniref:Methyltransferase domain-containing protein n=1 Tax=Ditylenchus destructor TaxID=166010 RepID=A0AAD4MGX5_9BILA|nr:methyltransferase domain-containing protein [Ditylenchus destructor]
MASSLMNRLSNPYITIVLTIFTVYLLLYPLKFYADNTYVIRQNKSEKCNCAKWNIDEEVKYMEKLAVQAGTAKSSTNANYTRIYPMYFYRLKDEPIQLLEIGIFRGQSVRLWENYFSKAELHFIDLPDHRDYIEYYSNRSQYHFINQTHVDQLIAMANTSGPFDVIIYDAGHNMNEQILSFETLFPYVKAGGMYVIEDIFTSYWKEKGGLGSRDAPMPGPGTTIDFLKKLVDHVNFVSASFGFEIPVSEAEEQLASKMSYYTRRINSIHFYDVEYSIGLPPRLRRLAAPLVIQDFPDFRKPYLPAKVFVQAETGTNRLGSSRRSD